MAVPITLRDLSKLFGKTVAVDHVHLAIQPGELFFLLGPSGCGKTTILRMIGGFVEPTTGTIDLGGRDVTHLAANQRDSGMVFQSYALWPHMTVAGNVAFGLQVRKVSTTEQQRRVRAALEMVEMADFAQRKPNQLSGGQQQRVALARALVIEPAVLLLDEPLSNLDARLRLHMRQQIRAICKRAGITGLYVTHDQKEALSMADRMAVMQNGKVVQVGTPRELYRRPGNRFVADFLGETNFVSATVVEKQPGLLVLQSAMGKLVSSVFPAGLDAGTKVTCSIRPEAVLLSGVSHRNSSESVNQFTTQRIETTFLGEMAQHILKVNEEVRLKALELHPGVTDVTGSNIQISIDPGDVAVLKD